jgi:hypothetical protein
MVSSVFAVNDFQRIMAATTAKNRSGPPFLRLNYLRELRSIFSIYSIASRVKR